MFNIAQVNHNLVIEYTSIWLSGVFLTPVILQGVSISRLVPICILQRKKLRSLVVVDQDILCCYLIGSWLSVSVVHFVRSCTNGTYIFLLTLCVFLFLQKVLGSPLLIYYRCITQLLYSLSLSQVLVFYQQKTIIVLSACICF